MDTPHIPERRCVGCGRHAPKRELARFVAARQVDGGRRLERDVSGVKPGRGLYVCPTRACFERAVERRAFQRAARLRDERLDLDDELADEFDR